MAMRQVAGAWILLLLSLQIHHTWSECPNACSSNGLCDFYDMCNCFRGFTGGDCSERMCPWDYSFVTTPQGDLNMDGDRDDNSWRRLSKSIREFTVGGSTITMNGAFDHLEVDYGDLIKVDDQVYEIQWTCTYTIKNITDCHASVTTTDSGRRLESGDSAVMGYNNGDNIPSNDSPDMINNPNNPSDENMCRSCTRLIDYPNRTIGDRWTELSVESRMDGLLHGFVGVWAEPEDELLTESERLKREAKIKKNYNGYPAYRHLRTQSQPYGTWEKWPGNFFGAGQTDTVADEGHFYMECSNRGTCNRANGICACHPGYTGKGCQLQQCPGVLPPKNAKSEYAVGVPCNGHGTCMTVDELARNQPTTIASRVSTSAGSPVVYTEKDLTTLLKPKDQILIGNDHDIGMSNNRMGGVGMGETHMGIASIKPVQNSESTNRHPMPYSIDTVEHNRIVLTQPYHRTQPYGTELKKITKYDLWDTHKNRACTCDSRWFGHACELKKCPRGDDPLTQLSYDGADSTVVVTNEKQRVSFYEQKPERQTLYMSTNGGRLFGTFCLTMEDEYGDRWTTKPIPTKVRLSMVPQDSPTYVYHPVTGEVEEFGVIIDFGLYQQIGDHTNVPSFGLRIDEIGLGDLLQCGDEFRVVQQLIYMDASTKIGRTRYRYVKTSGAMRDLTAGRPWYRINVAKEIRESLLKLPYLRMKDVAVEGSYKTGRRLSADVNTYLNVDRAEFYSPVANSDSPEDTLVVGDYMRVGQEIRQVLAITTPNLKYQIKPFFYPTTFSGAFKHTGMDYEISFSTGCTKHLDCQHNGINDHDSDSGSNTSPVTGYEDGATCHPGGICQCSDPTVYSGDGCTRSGKGTHAAAAAFVSAADTANNSPLPGNLPLLHCDTRHLYPGQTLSVTGSVTRLKPNRLHLTGTPYFPSASTRAIQEGDHLVVDHQRRQIINIVDLDDDPTSGPIDVIVDYPFQENAMSSSYSHLIVPHTAIERVGGPSRAADGNDNNKGRHGNFVRCLVTDIRPVSDETFFCEENSERPHCGRATVSGTDTWLNRIVTFGGRTTDPNDYDSDSNLNEKVPGVVSSLHELKVGDRLRIITSGTATENNNVSPVWETRTIDSVHYEHTPMGIIPSVKVITGVTVSFGYSSPHDMKPVFVDTRGSTENLVCSGRGLCNEGTGECKCFNGYGSFDCSRQEVVQM